MGSMTTRRKFLSALGLGLLGAPLTKASDLTRRRERWEMLANEDPTVTAEYKPDPSTWSDATLTAAWIGHSTVFINFFGMKILTDPVFSEKIGLRLAGLFTVGPRRLVYPALRVDELPRPDLILLSHTHLDHLDVPSLRDFDRSIPIVMAKNTSDVIEDLDFATVYELDWNQWTLVGDLRVEAIEVRHFGWRFPWEEDRSRGNPEGRSYNAYLLSSRGRHIVFGGDTAYQEHFKRLGARNLTIDLAIMPIGAYDPWVNNHANPEQALAMADHMIAARILPVHWGTFVQSEEPTGEPILRLKRALQDRPGHIVIDAIGKTWALAPDADIRDRLPPEQQTTISPTSP
jgi:L-ascorbate metabolism protein UlaG (beta-lactamase superfamily)